MPFNWCVPARPLRRLRARAIPYLTQCLARVCCVLCAPASYCTVKYGCSQDEVCVVTKSGPYFDDQCEGMCDPQGYKWACVEGRCVESDATGNYSDDTCAHSCVAPAPGPPPAPRYSCSKNGSRVCQRDESGIMPYYLNPNCDGECRGHVPGPAPAPGPDPAPPRPPEIPHPKEDAAAHVFSVVGLSLIGLAAVGGAGFLGLRYKRDFDQRKSYSEMGPRIGDPLLQ